jgi:hypothetical protein
MEAALPTPALRRTNMRELPNEGQDFQTIRHNDLLYVDKTEFIHKIISTGGSMLLTRPRRFGKSLLLGTMEELLKGNRELFKGLWIDSAGYGFKKYPVVKLTMNSDYETPEELKASIMAELQTVAEANSVAVEGETLGIALRMMVRNIKRSAGEKVAVLIDEYDAPIQSQIHDIQLAEQNRRILHNFYSSLKTLADDDQLFLLFVTGVTKFAKASIFSSFNNLDDLTMNHVYNAVCGFTHEEFDTYFTEYLPGVLEYSKSTGDAEPGATVEDLRKQILDYYDGYSWDGINRILNPFSLIKCLDAKKLKPFWYFSASASFLFELIRKKPLDYVLSESPVLSEASLEAVDIASLKLTPLLFQTGYLTVEREISGGEYLLASPNLEVEKTFNTQLLPYLTGQEETTITSLRARIKAALENFDSEALGAAFSQILRWVPYQEQPALEGYHHAILLVALKSLQFGVFPEVSESEGRFDILIHGWDGTVFITEFKYEKFTPEPNQGNEAKRRKLMKTALKRAKDQIKFRRYDASYQDEYPLVKKLAVGIVGKADVLLEIY